MPDSFILVARTLGACDLLSTYDHKRASRVIWKKGSMTLAYGGHWPGYGLSRRCPRAACHLRNIHQGNRDFDAEGGKCLVRQSEQVAADDGFSKHPANCMTRVRDLCRPSVECPARHADGTQSREYQCWTLFVDRQRAAGKAWTARDCYATAAALHDLRMIFRKWKIPEPRVWRPLYKQSRTPRSFSRSFDIW